MNVFGDCCALCIRASRPSADAALAWCGCRAWIRVVVVVVLLLAVAHSALRNRVELARRSGHSTTTGTVRANARPRITSFLAVSPLTVFCGDLTE